MGVDRFQLPADGVSAAQVCLAQRTPAGDPVRLRAVAHRSAALAAELRQIAGVLLSGAESSLWRGAGHQAFVVQLRSHAPALEATAGRYEGYALALSSYAGVLDDMAGALHTTRRLLQQRSDEIGAAAHAGSAAEPADLLPLAHAFKAGYDRWADALDRCVQELHGADERDPSRDLHGFGALRQQIGHAAAAVLSPYEQAVRHPSLRSVSACLGQLNTAFSVLGLGLLFICPPAGAACLAAATVLAVAQLMVDSTRRAHGEAVSNTSLGLELAAAIPLGGNALRAARAAEGVVHLVPGGGLVAHEAAGGHTLLKHVDKSEEYLRHRLATEPHIRGASTFYDRQTAESAISELIAANRTTVNRWLHRGTDELVLAGRASTAVGVLVPRGSSKAIAAHRIRIVLLRNADMETGYLLLTAMVIE